MDSIYSCIQRRASVTLFYESVDRIALIARRVKLPRGRLLSGDLLECAAWPLPVSGSGPENRAYTRQVFSARCASSWGPRYGYTRSDAMGGLAHIKEAYCERTVGR